MLTLASTLTFTRIQSQNEHIFIDIHNLVVTCWSHLIGPLTAAHFDLKTWSRSRDSGPPADPVVFGMVGKKDCIFSRNSCSWKRWCHHSGCGITNSCSQMTRCWCHQCYTAVLPALRNSVTLLMSCLWLNSSRETVGESDNMLSHNKLTLNRSRLTAMQLSVCVSLLTDGTV